MGSDRDKLMQDLLADLAGAITTFGLYAPEHPRAAAIVDKLGARLQETLAGEKEMTLVLLGEELFVQGVPVTQLVRQAPTLIRRLRRRGIEHVSFTPGVSPAELRGLLGELASADAEVHSRPHIVVGHVEMSESELGGPDSRLGGKGKHGRLPPRRDRIVILTEIFAAMAGGESPDVASLQRIVEAALEELAEDPDPLHLLAQWDGDARWPAVHGYNTCVLTCGLAAFADVPGPSRLDLGLAALLHDVGKLSWPVDVAAREMSLESDEIELLLDHPRNGAQILLGARQVPPLAAIVAYEHHLNFNGTGYPRLQRPRRPHPAARLVTVAEAFTILNTLRGHRGLETRESTMAWLSTRAGSMLDPGWVTVFQELLDYDSSHPFEAEHVEVL